MLAADLLPETPGVRVVEIVADATSIVATVENDGSGRHTTRSGGTPTFG
jgi:hypothetical protein